MPAKLIVNFGDVRSMEFLLRERAMRLGSAADCDLIVAHPEIAPLAAVLEARQDEVYLRNLNSYSVYVGNTEVPAGGSHVWPSGQRLAISQNVSFDLQSSGRLDAAGAPTTGPSTAANDAELEGSEVSDVQHRRRTYLQTGVIGVCAIAAVVLLMNDSAPTVVERGDTFADIIADFAKIQEPSREDLAVRRYLQQAWIADLRRNPEQSESAKRAYQILLAQRPVASAKAGEPGATVADELHARIRAFALGRLTSIQAETARN